MTVYKVIVQQTVIEECTVYVEADDVEAAVLLGEEASLEVVDWDWCEVTERDVIGIEPAPAGQKVWPEIKAA